MSASVLGQDPAELQAQGDPQVQGQPLAQHSSTTPKYDLLPPDTPSLFGGSSARRSLDQVLDFSRISLNPNAAEFVPTVADAATSASEGAGAEGRPTRSQQRAGQAQEREEKDFHRVDSANSTGSDDEFRQLLRAQLPDDLSFDDITKDNGTVTLTSTLSAPSLSARHHWGIPPGFEGLPGGGSPQGAQGRGRRLVFEQSNLGPGHAQLVHQPGDGSSPGPSGPVDILEGSSGASGRGPGPGRGMQVSAGGVPAHHPGLQQHDEMLGNHRGRGGPRRAPAGAAMYAHGDMIGVPWGGDPGDANGRGLGTPGPNPRAGMSGPVRLPGGSASSSPARGPGFGPGEAYHHSGPGSLGQGPGPGPGRATSPLQATPPFTPPHAPTGMPRLMAPPPGADSYSSPPPGIPGPGSNGLIHPRRPYAPPPDMPGPAPSGMMPYDMPPGLGGPGEHLMPPWAGPGPLEVYPPHAGPRYPVFHGHAYGPNRGPPPHGGVRPGFMGEAVPGLGPDDPVRILSMEFPNYSADSLLDIFVSNGSDLGRTLEMLTQLELQDEAARTGQRGQPRKLQPPTHGGGGPQGQGQPNFRPLGASDFPTLGRPGDAADVASQAAGLNPEGMGASPFRHSTSSTDFAAAVRKQGAGGAPPVLHPRHAGPGAWQHERRPDAGRGRGGGYAPPHAHARDFAAHPGQSQWLDTGDSVTHMYGSMREEARDHARIRNAYFEQATKAYLSGNKALAKELSTKGQWHNEQMKTAHSRASDSIFRQRNMASGYFGGRGVPRESEGRTLDLHGLHVGEALPLLRRELSALRNAARISGQQQLVLVCVGTGHHTKGRMPARLPAAVERFLAEEEGVHFSEAQPGLLRVLV